MVKSAAIKSRTTTPAPATKAGNAKAVQRKLLPSLQVLPSPVQRKEKPGSWVYQQSLRPVNSRPLVQPKIKVHASDDHFEKEADHVADKVVSTQSISSPVKVSKVSAGTQRKCASCEKEEKEVQACHVQRKCSSCEEAESVQKKHNNHSHDSKSIEHSSDSSPPSSGFHNHQALDTVLSKQSTGGAVLPQATRAHMENRMSADFSNVRIHTGPASHEASTSIGARAFTHGNNIHFANGEFNPGTKSGQHLLAHELTHTMQQGAAPSKANPGNGPPSGLRKLVPKAKFEKKRARIPTPYEDRDSSRKKENEDFSKKFRNKKAAKLSSSALKKEKGKKLKKDPPALPKKEEKKKDKPGKAPVKPNHLLNVKNQQAQLGQLSSKGISFKPLEDKKDEEDPAYKAQSLASKKISENILNKAASSANNMANTIASVRPRLSKSSANAIARIKANEFEQKEKITNEIKTEKAAAKKAMQTAYGSINARHKKVVSDLKAAAKTGRDDILKAKTKNTDDIKKAAKDQTPIIQKTYNDAQKSYETIGSELGRECSRRQKDRAQTEFLSKLIHEDDNIWDGPYTDDMKKARADAAVKVGDGYNDGIAKAGVDQGKEIHKGMPNDLKKVAEGETEMLKHVNETYDRALKAIDTSEKSAISQADSTKKSMLSSVSKQHKAAQAKLDATQKTQIQMTEILSLKQCQQIELQAQQAIESMEEGGAQSLMHLNNGFKEYKQVCESMNSPPPAMLMLKLQPIEERLSMAAPSMSQSLLKGMQQMETKFNSTATETITTTNTTVTEALDEAKATNEKAIEGLKKLQSSAITALQGIFTKNKKTIGDTASQCVTDIGNIKTNFDTALAKIATDLKSGMEAGAEEFRKGLTNTIDHGAGETKSLLNTSQIEEEKAADEVSPRWKSVLKVLLVIAVILVIALVVGPAVIGFIGAAAGGGAFGAAVGAVVGGAILGAASSAVITIGNNLIDGKTWYKGVGQAMLEGAITGAIGGAFGAAGSGIAGKIIGQAAKGVGPALGRFAIQQTVDFAGNVVTEFATSKITGKPFSWTSVAQGQAIGAGMHIGMGGLSSLKDVKGFKTINKITEGSGKLGESFGKSVKAKISGTPHIETKAGGTKPAVDESPGGTKPVEESKAKPQEETAPAPKEEPHSKPAEESKTAPKEEPPTKTTDDTKTPAKEDQPGTTSKETSKPAEPGEITTPGGKKKNELPSNLTQEDVELGIVGKAQTEDGHHIKVSEDGAIIKCSTCQRLKDKYSRELADPDIKAEFDKIEAMPNGEAKARAARNFDRRMEARLIREYRAARKSSEMSDADIKARIRAGDRMNPETKLFNKAETDLVVDKPAKFVQEGTGPNAKTKVEQFDPKSFPEPVTKGTDDLLNQRRAAQERRDAHAEGTPEFKQGQTEVIKASEEIGNKAAEGVAHAKGFTGEPLNTGSEFRSGKGTFDRVFEKDGKYLVAESKGGGNDLGSKEVMIKGEPVRVEQGTKEYFESTCREMMGPNRSPKEQELGAKLLAASQKGEVDYILVQQPVNVKNELGTVKVKTFDQ